jgi:hypothetical protein
MSAILASYKTVMTGTNTNLSRLERSRIAVSPTQT